MNEATTQHRIAVFHNLLWPRYKAAVFTEAAAKFQVAGIDVAFIHIAETDRSRAALGRVDVEEHRYPYRVLFRTPYELIPKVRLTATLCKEVFSSNASIVVLPGYSQLEHWAMLVTAWVLRKKIGVFCDSTIHDRKQSGWKGVLKRIFFARCDLFFAYGIRSEEYLLAYGADRGKIRRPCQAAAVNAVDAKARGYLRASSRAKYPRYLYVGRLAPEKGLFDLLSAFALLVRERPDARLVLVGEGALRIDVEGFVAENALADHVLLCGALQRSEIDAQYAEASCLVLPSHSEPWGLVVNEALHMGCPVITTSVCGCVPELVGERTGLVVNAGSPSQLLRAMRSALTEFSDTDRTATACMERVHAFSPAHAAENIVNGCLAELRR